MRLIHYGKYALMATVAIGDKFYRIPMVIDVNSRYANTRKKNRVDIFGCQHVEQSTDGTQMYDFTDKHFYKLGKQLAKL